MMTDPLFFKLIKLDTKKHHKTYFYRKDVQGNIIAILDENGAVVVKYVYDAWGNHAVLDADGNDIDDADHIGNLNPFRYRGYYYDVETGLYYLQTRYYDPETGRFISQDSVEYADPTTVNGLNLYAYCGNNPVMNVDPMGTFIIALAIALAVLCSPAGGAPVQLMASSFTYIGMAIASIFDSDIKNDMNLIGWDMFNTNEQAVLDSTKVSFYKGAPVIRTDETRSGTFGMIFLSRGHFDRSGFYIKENNPDTVRHEYGHIIQQMMMGPFTYGITVGIPSPLKLGPWAKANDYYGAPWETLADILGGVQKRTHTKTEINRAWGYYAVSMLNPLLAYLYLL